MCDAEVRGALHDEHLAIGDEGKMILVSQLPAPSWKFPHPQGIGSGRQVSPQTDALSRWRSFPQLEPLGRIPHPPRTARRAGSFPVGGDQISWKLGKKSRPACWAALEGCARFSAFQFPEADQHHPSRSFGRYCCCPIRVAVSFHCPNLLSPRLCSSLAVASRYWNRCLESWGRLNSRTKLPRQRPVGLWPQR